MSAPIVEVSNLTKNFGGTPVFAGLNLSIAEGEFLCLVGGSGSGKSTLLNIIAGLDRADSGIVTAPPAAVMFQESALLPWLSAAGNVSLALKFAGVPRSERAARTAELLRTVRLPEAGNRLVHQLSGGMQQRVALARALAQNRTLLLMDEPFSALDSITRDFLHDELEDIWRATGRTIVLVTHNVREAIRLGQRVVLLASDDGSIAGQWEVSDVQRHDAVAGAALAETIRGVLHREVHGLAAVS
ncbi:ATP-binding cassette domain-containing protein [Arthrobacter sp. JZ12]|uniref:ABC transporter ATP-binding protein n=1 Tax=Arthrobacter sp. JZ12 TaxID=2654190 RepID=UPI002B463B01|nr:ABC transporter ATP-binding protein [Arthrobacter sp. JZ12]WRH25693.1 ATP-binding cassette domain-containing protein [Arthrobacter sp. JZ12]